MQQPDKIDSQSGKPEMSSKNNKKKRRQKKKHNQKPIVSGTDCSQVEQDTCQDSIVTGNVAEKSNTGLEKTKNTAQTSLVTKTVVDKLETSLDGNVIKKPNNSFEGIKDAAENLTVTGNITKKSKCGLTKGILKNTSQSSIKTGNVTDKPNNSFEKIKNSTQNSKVTGNVTEKPNNGFEGIGTYAHRLDIFKKISNLLSVDNKWLIIALEKLLVLYDDVSAEKELRMQTMHLLLNHLETSDSEELMALLKICKDPFIHQAFEKYIVDGKTLRIENILLGMEYIASMNYVHRDLACKNIFVNSKKQCKIGDFGLCKSTGDANGFYKEKKYFLAMYHTAPESKLTQIFSTKSDVWSMGILMWEIYFTNISGDCIEYPLWQFITILSVFELTGRLPCPKQCPDSIFEYIMTEVLLGDPRRRPTFTAIKKFLSKHLAV